MYCFIDCDVEGVATGSLTPSKKEHANQRHRPHTPNTPYRYKSVNKGTAPVRYTRYSPHFHVCFNLL